MNERLVQRIINTSGYSNINALTPLYISVQLWNASVHMLCIPVLKIVHACKVFKLCTLSVFSQDATDNNHLLVFKIVKTSTSGQKCTLTYEIRIAIFANNGKVNLICLNRVHVLTM